MTTLPWKFRLIGLALSASLSTSLAFAQTDATDGEPPEADPAAENKAADAEGGETGGDDASGSSEEKAATDEATGSEDEAADGGEESAEEAAIDGATYRVRLRDLEQRVDELKEQIRRSHTRLSLLSDTILSGASGGARAEIEFVNNLSGAWHVVEAVFVLDGAVQYKKTDDSGVLAKQKRIPIFSGSVPAGDHTLQVLLKLRGHGFGVFSYLRGMEASLTTDHSFTITGGKVLELKATAWEQGGPTTPVEEQPDIRFEQTIRKASDAPKGAPTPSGGSAGVKAEDQSKDGKVGGELSVGGSTAK